MNEWMNEWMNEKKKEGRNDGERKEGRYFIVLTSSVKTKEVKVIEFHRIGWIPTDNYKK